MEPFKKIAFLRTGTSGDAGAFARAIRLCRNTSAELHILGLLPQPPSALRAFLESWGADPQQLVGESELSTELEKLVDSARQQKIHVESQLLRGDPTPEIVQNVSRENYDLLIKTAQPSTGIRRVLFGHTDRQLLRRCPCPVWIDKPSVEGSHNRILAAVDPAPFREEPDFDPVRDRLNMRILELASRLAQAENADLHVVHVWSFPLEGSLQSRAGFTQDVVSQMAQSIKQTHEEALEKLLTPFRKQIARVHFLKGKAPQEISNLVANQLFDVIVMGTVCRTDLSGFFIGNTAETVLDQVDCSIAALKPE